MTKEDSKDAAQDTAKAEKKAKQESQVAKARAIITKAGGKGITADDLAKRLGLLKEDMEDGDRSVALKKTRVLARKATDGATPKKEGRQVHYVISG